MRMSLKVTLELKKDTLFLNLRGTFDMPLLRHTIQEVGRQCRQSGCRQILADARAHVGGISTLELHQIGEMISREIPRGYRVAVVVNTKRLPMDRHLETVAVNRGVPFRLFTSIEEANLWLRCSGMVAVKPDATSTERDSQPGRSEQDKYPAMNG